MAENLKYNLKDELLDADERLTGSLGMMGPTMLTFPGYINSMRSVMWTAHQKQLENLENPDLPGIFTGGETVVGKHSSGYLELKHDSSVYRIIKKFDDIVENPFISKIFIFDEKKKQFDVIERNEVEDLTEVYGFSYNNEVIDNLHEGDYLEKGTVLYKSKSYDEDMNYGYGKNLKVMYGLDPYTSEDGCVISESCSRKMNSIETFKVPVGINQNDFLLNMYGNQDNYKPFPDIGEYSNGEIAIKRTMSEEQLFVDFKDSSLQTPIDSDVSY